MNEQLKFSWGHIVAFVALIFIGYTTFVGVTYLTNGDFLKASIAMAIVCLVLLLIFIGAQVAKSTTRKFKKIIWIERILVFASPIIFLLCIYPYCHFWTVHSQDTEIVDNFTSAINSSKQMFEDYEQYANTRVDNYDKMLSRVIADKENNSATFTKCGFVGGNTRMQKANMVQTLKLQLLSVNYDSLKVEATKWIDSSSKGASTWNVFLLGNTRAIRSAIHSWNEQLQAFSRNKLTNEEISGNVVKQFDGGSFEKVDQGFNNLTSLFTQKAFPNIVAIITAVILFFALLFPYILQDRHTKSLYRLIGMKGDESQTNMPDINISSPKTTTKKSKKKDAQSDSITIDNNQSGNNDDEFSSFNF